MTPDRILKAVPHSLPAPDFEDFWQAWPKFRRIGKKEARQEWNKLNCAQQQKAIEQAPIYGRFCLQEGRSPAYTLHACRWLKYERFDDELQAEVKYCEWPGCDKATEGAYCEPHLAAKQRGETPCLR